MIQRGLVMNIPIVTICSVQVYLGIMRIGSYIVLHKLVGITHCYIALPVTFFILIFPPKILLF